MGWGEACLPPHTGPHSLVGEVRRGTQALRAGGVSQDLGRVRGTCTQRTWEGVGATSQPPADGGLLAPGQQDSKAPHQPLGPPAGAGSLGPVSAPTWLLDRDRIGGKTLGFKARHLNSMVLASSPITRPPGRFAGKTEPAPPGQHPEVAWHCVDAPSLAAIPCPNPALHAWSRHG